MRKRGLLFLVLIKFTLIPAFTQSNINSAELQDSVGSYWVKIDRIFILGNKRTKSKIISREMLLTEGEQYKRASLSEIIEKDQNKIYNTQLFIEVSITPLEIETGVFDIVVRVSERWYTFPIPIVELADRDFNEWWFNQNRNLNRLIYGMRFHQYNMRGRNETLKVTAQLGYTHNLELGYSVPYINRAQTKGLSFDVGYANNRNIAFKTESHKQQFVGNYREEIMSQRIKANVSYSMRESFYNTHIFNVGFREQLINDTIRTLNGAYFINDKLIQNYFLFEYLFRRDMRDNVGYPLTGFLIDFKFRKFGLGLFADVEQTEFYLEGVNYLKLGRGFYVSNFLGGYASFGSKLPYTHLNALGYNDRIVRGYELYIVEGQQYALSKNVIKKRLFKKVINVNWFPFEQFRKIPLAIYLKTYADAAYSWNNLSNLDQLGNNFLVNRFISGTGIGFDIVSFYDVVYQFEYSINDLGEHGLYFHLNINI